MSKIELKLQASTKIVTAYLLKISEILLIEMGLIYVLDKVGMGG